MSIPLAILTLCMTSSSKDVERELPIWSSRSCGNVSRRYFFFLSEPHVVYTCRYLTACQAILRLCPLMASQALIGGSSSSQMG